MISGCVTFYKCSQSRFSRFRFCSCEWCLLFCQPHFSVSTCIDFCQTLFKSITLQVARRDIEAAVVWCWQAAGIILTQQTMKKGKSAGIDQGIKIKNENIFFSSLLILYYVSSVNIKILVCFLGVQNKILRDDIWYREYFWKCTCSFVIKPFQKAHWSPAPIQDWTWSTFTKQFHLSQLVNTLLIM